MLQLTPDEQTWLEAYRKALNERYGCDRAIPRVLLRPAVGIDITM